MSAVLVDVILLLIRFLLLAIFAQVILSWLVVLGVRSEVLMVLYRAASSITDPLLQPLRRIVPSLGMIDITPMVAVIILIVLERVVSSALA